MKKQKEVAIIGGGIVGLFCAYEAARAGFSVVLFEREKRVGTVASTRNSGVLHAGIYYRENGLKARFCAKGNAEMYQIAAKCGVTHKRCGKLIIALNAHEEERLAELSARSRANGADGIRLITAAEIKRLEPNANGVAALYSPDTGVIDQPQIVAAARALAEAEGAMVLTGADVISAEPNGDGFTVFVAGRGEFEADALINAAGYGSLLAAQKMGCAKGLRNKFGRGCYAKVAPSMAGLVNALIYPVPRDGLGLGTHLTKTALGELLVGPDAEVMPDERNDDFAGFCGMFDFEPDPAAFYEAARAMLPSLLPSHLRSGDVGIRTKLQTEQGETLDDFVFLCDEAAPNALHLLGLESPAFTSSPEIGKYAAEWLKDKFG